MSRTIHWTQIVVSRYLLQIHSNNFTKTSAKYAILKFPDFEGLMGLTLGEL
jgi:hypothetical protein